MGCFVFTEKHLIILTVVLRTALGSISKEYRSMHTASNFSCAA